MNNSEEILSTLESISTEIGHINNNLNNNFGISFILLLIFILLIIINRNIKILINQNKKK